MRKTRLDRAEEQILRCDKIIYNMATLAKEAVRTGKHLIYEARTLEKRIKVLYWLPLPAFIAGIAFAFDSLWGFVGLVAVIAIYGYDIYTDEQQNRAHLQYLKETPEEFMGIVKEEMPIVKP